MDTHKICTQMLLLPLGDTKSSVTIYDTGVCINVLAHFRLPLDSRAKQHCFCGVDVMKEGPTIEVHIPCTVCEHYFVACS